MGFKMKPNRKFSVFHFLFSLKKKICLEISMYNSVIFLACYGMTIFYGGQFLVVCIGTFKYQNIITFGSLQKILKTNFEA
jgi:hypothetical protein